MSQIKKIFCDFAIDARLSQIKFVMTWYGGVLATMVYQYQLLRTHDEASAVVLVVVNLFEFKAKSVRHTSHASHESNTSRATHARHVSHANHASEAEVVR